MNKSLAVATGDASPKYVTHADLLKISVKERCRGIATEPVLALCHPEKNFWVFKAIVYKSFRCRGFVGYGDAHPGNVSPLIFNHAEMRMAETRAVNRALRKAYGVALCSLEELPPWALSAPEVAKIDKSLRSRSPFPTGAPHAHQNPRPQPSPRSKRSSGRVIPGPGDSLRTRRPRR